MENDLSTLLLLLSLLYMIRFFIGLNLKVYLVGLGGGLPPMPEDYCSKSSSTTTHQTLPAFVQPFGGGRSSFRGYSPPYTSQQSTGGPNNATCNPPDNNNWAYATPVVSETLTPSYTAQRNQPYSIPRNSRRQPPTNTATSYPQLSASANLSASK